MVRNVGVKSHGVGYAVVGLRPGETPAQALDRFKRVGSGRSKYRSQRTNGYDSKAEANYAARLGALKQAGAIRDWIEQVPIKLGDRITYRVDFMVIDLDYTVRFVEVKGYETKEYKLKRRLLEERRPEIAARLEVVR